MKARSMTHPCFVSPLNSLVERKSEQKETVEDSGKGKESALLKSIATDSNDIYFVIARALINEIERGQKRINCMSECSRFRRFSNSRGFKIAKIAEI